MASRPRTTTDSSVTNTSGNAVTPIGLGRIFCPLGEDSDKRRHGSEATGSAYQVSGWIKRSMMELGQHDINAASCRP